MRKILIVDDEISIRRVIKLNLETHGFSVIVAGTGEEGIEQIKKERPHLVILDLGLPDKPGLCPPLSLIFCAFLFVILAE